MHPHLWPALVGAAVGLPLIVWASWRLARRWGDLPGRTRWLAFAGLALFETAYWLNVYAWFVEPNLLVVRHVEFASADWRGAPLTVAALGDTHVGSPHVDLDRIGRVVERVNNLAPDLVVLLGDYAGGHEPEAARGARERSLVLDGIGAFAALEAPLGVVAVIGNHDVWYGRASIMQALAEAGVAPLWNRNVDIDRDGGSFVIAGLADADTGEPDFAAALSDTEERDTIVISHSPDPFSAMPQGPALMLAAHSHCGQVTVPLIGRPVLPIREPRYACRRVDEAGRVMYVTAGIGTSILPVRFLNPPEIVLITVRRAR